MKKYLLLFSVIVCLSFASQAQITKGSFFIGGNVGYSTTTEERTGVPTPTNPEGKSSTTVISPAIGIAVKPNLIAGIDFSYGRIDNENFQGAGSFETKVLGAGLFLRRYFPVAQRFYAFGQVGLGYTDTEAEQRSMFNPNQRDVTNGWLVDASLSPGVAYNLTKTLYLEAGFDDLFRLAYRKERREEIPGGSGTTFTTNRKNFSISSSLSGAIPLTVGIRFIFPRR